jgi:transposase
MDKKNKEISEIVGYSVQYITELVSKYLNEGMDAILIDKRTGNRRNMSIDEERAFLEQFNELAEAGQILSINVIMEKYKEVTGKECYDTTIYRLLKRHGWRKLAPRPMHPGTASEEEIESSKKLTKSTGDYWKNIQEASETGTKDTRA